jgi:4-amino-4-deoxy-L-arabinose transferase-like glycosyltransferase
MRKSPLEALTPARALAALIVLALLLPGLFGHDPWKPDEAYTFGLVHHILDTGEWIVPTLAGEPFMEKPPLYYLVAAALAWLFAPALPLHDGARVASFAFVGAALVFAGLAARRLNGPGHGVSAVLLLAGSLGLAMHAHTMITDTALLAGFAIAVYGLACALDRPLRAGAFLGTGLGIGFMSKGLVEPAMVGLALALLPILFRDWRARAYGSSLLWALAFASPWLLTWPVALYLEDRASFMQWFWVNNFGRYLGFAHLGATDEAWYFTRTLPWFTFPSGVLAGFAAVRALRAPRSGEPPRLRTMQVTASVTIGILAVLGSSASVREVYALPVLVPLAILASCVVDAMPRRLAFAATRVTGVIAIVVASFAWSVWTYGIVNGRPPALPFLVGVLPMDFPFRFDLAALAGALLITAVWIAAWRGSVQAWLPRWTANLALGWGVCMTLLLPWIDDAKSFRDPFTDLAMRLPRATCVASQGLGEGQRAMLDYIAGLKTRRLESAAAPCPYLLTQSRADGSRRRLPEGEWSLVWQGARNGESREAFLLYEDRGAGERLAAAQLLAARAHLPEPRSGQHRVHSGAVAMRRGGEANDPAVGVEHRGTARGRGEGH